MMMFNRSLLKTGILMAFLLPTALLADEKQQSLLDIYHQALAHDPTLASALALKFTVGRYSALPCSIISCAALLALNAEANVGSCAKA